MSKGVELIAIEQKRQIEELGFDYTNNDLYADEQLAKAAAVYTLRPHPIKWKKDFIGIYLIWPWSMRYWKPTPSDRIKELTKAGALIAAQIDYELNKK